MAVKSPKRRPQSNGRLEEAMALLIQNQATFVSQLSRNDERFARNDERFARMDERFARMDERFALMEQRIDERFARIDERFARIEERLDKIEHTLAEHHQILLGLLESIRKEIGFKPSA